MGKNSIWVVNFFKRKEKKFFFFSLQMNLLSLTTTINRFIQQKTIKVYKIFAACGHSTKSTRLLAFEFAVKSNKISPSSWIKNNNAADIDRL